MCWFENLLKRYQDVNKEVFAYQRLIHISTSDKSPLVKKTFKLPYLQVCASHMTRLLNVKCSLKQHNTWSDQRKI